MANIIALMHWDFDADIVEFFNHLTDNKFFEFLFKLFTNLGTETIFIAILAIFYWAVDKKLTKEFAIPAFFSMTFNSFIKSLFVRFRPFQQYQDRIVCRDETILSKDLNGNYIKGANEYGEYLVSSSSSFPSGHSNNSASFYTSFSYKIKKRFLWIILEVVIFLVMISRMALGVHFFSDVLTGYALGTLFVLGYFKLVEKTKKEKMINIILLIFFGIIAFLSPIYTKENTRDMFITYGICIGLFFGTLFEEKYVDFKKCKSFYKNILRIVIGINPILIIKIGFKYAYSWIFLEGSYIANILDMIRYSLMLFIGAGIYPIFIKKIKFLND